MMKRVGIIGTAALLLLLGTTVPLWAQHGKPAGEQAKSDKQAKDKGKAKAGTQQSKQQEQKAAPQAKREQEPQRAQQPNRNQEQRQAQQEQRGRQQEAQQQRADRQNVDRQNANRQDAARQNAARQRQANQQQQVTDRRNAARQRQVTQQRQTEDRRRAAQVVTQQPDNRPPGWDKGKKVGWQGGDVPPGHQARLPQQRQRVLITQQRRRWVDYRRSLDQQRARERQWAATLQQQRRMTYYRYQQDYWARMRQQQQDLQRYNNYNYNNDPYFYTASNYRYSYGGNNYQTNQYGADMLRAAVNNGYAEGYRAGEADRQDRFGGGYQNSYAYQDANLGYNGMYVNQGDYNYYFRQGFNRGYQDGYNGQYQYGQYSNGNRSILGAILGTILNLQSLR